MNPENKKQVTAFLLRLGVEFTRDDYNSMSSFDKFKAILAVDHMYTALVGDRLTELARQQRREDLYELIEALWHRGDLT